MTLERRLRTFSEHKTAEVRGRRTPVQVWLHSLAVESDAVAQTPATG